MNFIDVALECEVRAIGLFRFELMNVFSEFMCMKKSHNFQVRGSIHSSTR